MQRVMSVDTASAFILKSNPPQVGVAAAGKVPTSGWTHPALEAWLYIVAPADGIQDFDFVAQPPIGISLPMVSPIAVHAVITRNPQDYWGEGKPLKGVRIHARENSVEAPVDAKEARELTAPLTAAMGDNPVPWPWLVSLSGDGLPVPWPFPWSRGAEPMGGYPWPWPWRPSVETASALGMTTQALAGGSDTPFPLAGSPLDWLLLGKPVRVYHTGDPLTKDLRPDRVNLELNKQTERIIRVWWG
jgi:hypothetical protein